MQYPEEVCVQGAEYNVQAHRQLKCGDREAADLLFKKSFESFKRVLKIDPKDPVAQCNVAYMYHSGSGVTKNSGAAMRLYLESAKQKNTRAMYNLGVIYETGDAGMGVVRDQAEAVRWYKKAAAAGHEGGAQHNLGAMHYLGHGVASADKAKAAEWYLLSAEKGYTTSMVRLAGMHELGDGIPRNRGEAVRWYREAAAGGDDFASRRLQCLSDKTSPFHRGWKAVTHKAQPAAQSAHTVRYSVVEAQAEEEATATVASAAATASSSAAKVPVPARACGGEAATSSCAMCAKPSTGAVMRCGRCKQVAY
jgi:TPR repeat protein